MNILSRSADYRREDYMFQREQSLPLRLKRWEARTAPIKPRWHYWANVAGFIAFLATVVLVTSWAR